MHTKPLPFILFALLFLLVSSFPSTALCTPQWTYMVYMGADNNISGSAVTDIEEMRRASFNRDINIVVQVELSPIYTFWLPDFIPDYNTYRLLIKDGHVTTYSAGGNLDMAHPDTLGNFISWSLSNWPAEKYCLVIWSHGSGWKDGSGPFKGAVQDDTSGTYMELAELSQGIASSGAHLDVVNFDACLMGMYEVAYEFRNTADYIVFSEETEPADGDPFTDILAALSEQPSMGPEELAAMTVAKFVNFYRNKNQSATKSAVRTDTLQSLHDYIEDLADTMSSSMDIYGSVFALARDSAQKFSTSSYVDIVSFLENIKNLPETGQKALGLKQFITEQVIVAADHYTASNASSGISTSKIVDSANGLSIYIPSTEDFDSRELEKYEELSCNYGTDNGWYAFIEKLVMWSGDENGETLRNRVPGMFACGAAWFNTAGQWGDADVDMYILEPGGTTSAAWIGQSTPNGYFSGDSTSSGNSYEIYTSKPQIAPGDYFIIINYAANGDRDNYARVGVYYLDFLNNINTWTPLLPDLHDMSLWFPAPVSWDDSVIYGILLGYYSDWWVPWNWLSRSGDSTDLEPQINALRMLAYKIKNRKAMTQQPGLLKLFTSQ